MHREIEALKMTDRIHSLKEKTFSEQRYLSLDQAKIITRVYQENEKLSVILKRAKSLAQSLEEIPIKIDPEELIVGNRTPEIRAGVVFPEAGISWLNKEIESLPCRSQDPFQVREQDAAYFKENILPYWRGKTLEDHIYISYGEEIKAIEKVVKINQKDHAQGHICPDVQKWLIYGPAGLLKIVNAKQKTTSPEKREFYESVTITLRAAEVFIKRYARLADDLARKSTDQSAQNNLSDISKVSSNLAHNPPTSFREAIQSVWFLFVILQMESNASSFSPGRLDQYLYPYLDKDLKSGKTSLQEALELTEALWIKFNQIVYMRNEHSARYFAGFPIGFNVVISGQRSDGKDATNLLSYLILRAQSHIALPQPNLSARLHNNSPDDFLLECSRVIGQGSGMPQIFNDESILPSFTAADIEDKDALDYAVVGCVELSAQGNYLGWSDAAMFNLVKVLELTINNGRCMNTGDDLGLKTGSLPSYSTFEELENGYQKQIDFFIEKMIKACENVEEAHQKYLPSPFLSSVIDNCLDSGVDVTAGGARYNFSGIQAIQIANITDSLSALKKLIYDDELIQPQEYMQALQNNFSGYEKLRQICLNRVPKFGNDVEWVDKLGAKWITLFAEKLKKYKNYRNGNYHMGLYTVSAHVPMGKNVGATPDGRLSGTPLADGGVSPMYGRDKLGPTAVLKSVSRLPFNLASNGTLLNMKFLPSFFKNNNDLKNFSALLKVFIRLGIHHVQFNVVDVQDLLNAKKDPDSYRGLTIRVAGYTAYFTELAEDLQDEIIARTTFGGD